MPRYPKGFSLIELLTVIAVIAVLSGLVLVGLSKIRQRSDRIATAASLRSVGVAIQCYVSEQRGELPGPLYYSQGPRYKKNVLGSLGYYLWSYLGSPAPTSSWQVCEAITNPGYLRSRPSETSPVYLVQRSVRLPGQSGVSPFGYPDRDDPLRMSTLTEFDLREEWALQDLDQQSPDVATWDKSNFVSEPIHGDVRMTLFFDWHVEAVPIEN